MRPLLEAGSEAMAAALGGAWPGGEARSDPPSEAAERPRPRVLPATETAKASGAGAIPGLDLRALVDPGTRPASYHDEFTAAMAAAQAEGAPPPGLDPSTAHVDRMLYASDPSYAGTKGGSAAASAGEVGRE